MIYLDNASTSAKKPDTVMKAMMDAMLVMGNAGRGGSIESLQAERIIYGTRNRLAKLISAENASQIAFTHNATHALNLAIKGNLGQGDHVITTTMEHNSVLRPLYDMEKSGVEVTIVGKKHTINAGSRKGDKSRVDDMIEKISGNVEPVACETVKIDLHEIKDSIKKNTKAIICIHGSNLTGDINKLNEISKIAKENNLLFIVDASQTIGVVPINVQKLGIDILCFAGHKSLMGPQGTGGIYVKEGLKFKGLYSGGSGYDTFSKEHPRVMPSMLEAGTLNGHGISGLMAALDYINEVGVEVIWDKKIKLMKRFYEGVRVLEGVKIYGDFTTDRRCPIVALNIGEYDSAQVSDELSVRYGITTRSGGHCAPLLHKALGTESQGAVRFSFSYFNTEEEVDKAIEAVTELVNE